MKKALYKTELICIKYIPILIALIVWINTLLSFFDVYINSFNYIAGTSLLTIIPMYISSFVYKFCAYHRMFINYIVVQKVVEVWDQHIGINLNDFHLLLLYLIIAGLFMFIIILLYKKYGDRKYDQYNKKIS